VAGFGAPLMFLNGEWLMTTVTVLAGMLALVMSFLDPDGKLLD